MDKSSAEKLIKNVFNRPFEKPSFDRFVTELLNQIDRKSDHSNRWSGNVIPDSFKEHINFYERIGTYIDPNGDELDILLVRLKNESALHRARTMQRNFVAHHLKTRGERDAALVAYYAEGQPDWRFSLVRMEYKVRQDEATGQAKAEETLTPARRYSFLVGKDEPNHTAQQQLVPILVDDQHNPTLAQLENAFSIEPVTKEFFDRYKQHFIILQEELERIVTRDTKVRQEFSRCQIDTALFAKKLLGQLVFLYFLQKKGWLGVQPGAMWGSGSKKFLRELFDKEVVNYNNFFNDLLEPLFYQALASERSGNFYAPLRCQIPFLNGGLFEPTNSYDWQGTEILIDNAIFDKVFQTFDLYNFTVREDEPLEKEVAVDPEMLGKVFENLLEVHDRKSKGAFYTPREIVHYMCQESLINYLDTALNLREISVAQEHPVQTPLFGAPKPRQAVLTTTEYVALVPREDLTHLVRLGELSIEHEAAIEAGTKSYKAKLPQSVRTYARQIDDALADIKICDPAIGSGAFPVGMMHEIVRAREALTTHIKRGERSTYSLKRHAIQESLYGVDIDLSAVDIAKLRLWLSLVVDEDDYHSIKPLPNLDYKIVYGNSLLKVEKTLFNNDLLHKLQEEQAEYVTETNPVQKQQQRAAINKLIAQISGAQGDFDFEVYFSEVFEAKGGFDVVIGNPPYGAKINKDDLKKIEAHICDTENNNSAALFIDYSKNHLLKSYGNLAFIVPKSLLFSEKWLSLAFVLLKKTTQLIDVEKAFEKVKLEQVVFIYNPATICDYYIARKFLDKSFIRTTEIKKSYPPLFNAWICDVSSQEITLAIKIRGKSIFFNKFAEGFRGVPIQRSIRESGTYPILGGADLDRYAINGIKGYLTKYDLQGQGSKISKLHQPKLMAQNLVAHIQNPKPHIKIIATIDETGGIMNVDTVTNIVLKDKRYHLKYILALLNSNLLNWYAYKFIYCAAIRTMHFDDYYVGKLITANVTSVEQKPIIALVDQILATKRTNPTTDVSALERKIDQLVYALYGLTAEEIAIVEEQAAK